MNEIAQEIQKAKIGLLLKERFFGNLITYLEIKPNKNIPTFRTDGKCIEYSPTFARQLSRSEIIGVLAHEVMHCVFGHHLYRHGRHRKTWNYAGDYVINPILIDSEFTLPGQPLVDSRFFGMSTVPVYNILAKENPPKKEKPSGGEGGGGDGKDNKKNKDSFGDVTDSPALKKEKAGSQSELEAEKRIWQQRAAQAMASCKLAGKLPGGLGRVITELLTPKVSWREVTWSFVQQVVKEDYNFMKPNRKYFSSGLCLPSLHSEKVGLVVVGLDTSGSVNQNDLNQAAAELEEIQAVLNCELIVAFCDTEVQSSQKFSPGDNIKLEPKGGGGTSYSPVFEWVEKEQLEPACLIYLTDGQCRDFPEHEPDYPTLWVTNRKHWSVPFGEIVEF